MAAVPPLCDFGWKAPGFSLPGVDGMIHKLADLRGGQGTLIAFICNHCPYVKAVTGRLVRDADDLRVLGVATVAICANDATAYPEDGFDNMKAFARQHGFAFPYLHDEAQQVARRYGAVCTPDFFGFNAKLELQYRGRLDESRMALVPDARRDLYEAMKLVAETGEGPRQQIASMGCSIKWKAA
ncbi:MAG: thioredoxin family protein [Hyphomicrobiales bacterium]